MPYYAIAICTPMPFIEGPAGRRLEPISVEWHRARMALGVPTGFNYLEIRADGVVNEDGIQDVGAARNKAVDAAMSTEPRPEMLFFLDYDVIPSFDALTKLFYRARCYPDHDIFAGVYCCKSSPPEPLIYEEMGKGPFWDWTMGDLLMNNRVKGVHSGLTLIRTSLFARMEYSESNPLYKTVRKAKVTKEGIQRESGTEDLYFCDRAVKEAGAKICVDTSVLAGHINHQTGQIFGLPEDSPPLRKAFWMKKKQAGESAGEEPAKKRALDIGAGLERREWPGYETFTTDIRPDVGADFVMDTRLLNFRDEEFDLVASNHHLEHLPRFEQVRLWKEMARILKPGGRMEHTVPNLQWAGRKLAEAREDDHVFNVLYGSQDGDARTPHELRDTNVHYFGYTPQIARAMAEEVAGLVDVEVITYEQNEALKYHMLVRGRKPETEA